MLKHTIDIRNDDAYAVIKDLKKSGTVVNHIITDPPYNISQENQLHSLSNSKRQGVDFGEWDKNFDLYSWIGDYCDILDKNGSILIFNSYRHLSHIIDALEKHNIIVKDVIVWQKSNPMPRNTNRRYVQDMEFAVWGVKKGAKWVFNKLENQKYMRGLYTTATVSGKERTEHPTQKSLDLMKKIVAVHTNTGDIIIDPFMGSGTTGIACKELNRRFIGIEKDKKYFKIAQKRL